MPDTTINGVSLEAILNPIADDPELVERISYRKSKPELTIVEPDPQWLDHFETFKSRIIAALEPRDSDVTADQGEDGNGSFTILAIEHVGSTSVPNLPAKAIIDIDLVLSSDSLSAEAFYVPRLEAVGFQFLLREPSWYGHRFFYAWQPMLCNLHVWGPQCPAVERHRVFRDYLREHDDDRKLYAKTKREAAAVSKAKGETMDEYSARKNNVIQEIVTRAAMELGYVSQ